MNLTTTTPTFCQEFPAAIPALVSEKGAGLDLVKQAIFQKHPWRIIPSLRGLWSGYWAGLRIEKIADLCENRRTVLPSTLAHPRQVRLAWPTRPIVLANVLTQRGHCVTVFTTDERPPDACYHVRKVLSSPPSDPLRVWLWLWQLAWRYAAQDPARRAVEEEKVP